MKYTVTVWRSGQECRYGFGVLVKAFDMALSLRSANAGRIVVSDDAGRTYDHADLCRLFGLTEHRPVEGGPFGKEGASEPRSLAVEGSSSRA